MSYDVKSTKYVDLCRMTMTEQYYVMVIFTLVFCHAVPAWTAVPNVAGDKLHFWSKSLRVYDVIDGMCNFAEYDITKNNTLYFSHG